MLVLWKSVLTKYTIVHLSLQKQNLTLSVTRKLYESLIKDIESKKYETLFNEAHLLFKSIPSDMTVDVVQTRTQSKTFDPVLEKENLKTSLFDPVR